MQIRVSIIIKRTHTFKASLSLSNYEPSVTVEAIGNNKSRYSNEEIKNLSAQIVSTKW